MIQQLITANSTFLLHHGRSLTELLAKYGREKLCDILDRFWSKFSRYWEVLLHGNPVVDVLRGIKLALGGELGIGAGEEYRGSKERDSLENLITKSDGMTDLIVSRFEDDQDTDDTRPWLGQGRQVASNDGVIFPGKGTLTRTSVRDISAWIQQIYIYGEHAYGVNDNPSRKRRKLNPQSHIFDEQITVNTSVRQKLRDEHLTPVSKSTSPTSPTPITAIGHRPSIPPPIVSAAEQALIQASSNLEEQKKIPTSDTSSTFGTSEQWVKYLTFGLSTLARPKEPEKNEPGQREVERKQPSHSRVRSLTRTLTPPIRTKAHPLIRLNSAATEDDIDTSSLKRISPMPIGQTAKSPVDEQKRLENEGYFLIGYQGSLNGVDSPNMENTSAQNHEEGKEFEIGEDDQGSRIVLRTVHVNLGERLKYEQNDASSLDGSSTSTYRNDKKVQRCERLRVLIYVRKPFIYAFLFEQRTSALSMCSLYTTLHGCLDALHESLASVTSPENVILNISKHQSSITLTPTKNNHKKISLTNPVYDLLFDPLNLTIQSSIPNIPNLIFSATEDSTISAKRPLWSRSEALNVHFQILNTIDRTKDSSREMERSGKTSKGWWVIWMRLPPSFLYSSFSADKNIDIKNGDDQESYQKDSTTLLHSDGYDAEECRIAILIRKASDWTTSKDSFGSSSSNNVMSSMFGFGKMNDVSNTNININAASLDSGLGFDPRKYVEGLLGLGR